MIKTLNADKQYPAKGEIPFHGILINSHVNFSLTGKGNLQRSLLCALGFRTDVKVIAMNKRESAKRGRLWRWLSDPSNFFIYPMPSAISCTTIVESCYLRQRLPSRDPSVEKRRGRRGVF
jgi:hypothetical protein